MSEKNLVICDREIGYAMALAENISEREELHVKVYTFTSLERAFLFSQEKKIHILLVDEDLEGYEREVMETEAQSGSKRKRATNLQISMRRTYYSRSV